MDRNEAGEIFPSMNEKVSPSLVSNTREKVTKTSTLTTISIQ